MGYYKKISFLLGYSCLFYSTIYGCAIPDRESFVKIFSLALSVVPEITKEKREVPCEFDEEEYYSLHEVTWVDYAVGYFAAKTGIIVHGFFTQQQLQEKLKAFNVTQLLQEGPKPNQVLSIAAQQLIVESLLPFDRIIDTHLHNLGYDEGNYLNPKAGSLKKAKWLDYFTFLLLRYASGMEEPIGSTQQARERLQQYVAHFPKFEGIVLPIHPAYSQEGILLLEATGNSLSNESALKTALTTTSNLYPATSVHPFDPFWEEKLEQASAIGIKVVKWMPPQSIPPDSPLLIPYYKKLAALNMTLLAHSGPEHAIPTNELNYMWADWGNPLRFREALKLGVPVILAHSGHKELIPDLDDASGKLVPGHTLFLRLAREAHQKNQTGEWTGKLYGDLAAVTTHYGPEFTKELLVASQEEGIKFVYGTDYPYTNLIQPGKDAYQLFAQAGLLDPKYPPLLNEIRQWNPLLANFVFTFHIALEHEGKKLHFPLATFNGDFEDGRLLLIDEQKWQNYYNRETLF